MPRQARLDVLGDLHHVIIQGIEGTDIFCDDEDRGDFTSRISALVGITGARIVAWAFMTNHIHLLLLSGRSGLSSFMLSLGGWSQVLSLRGKSGKIEYDSRILGSGDFVRKILKDADKKLERQLQYRRPKETVDDVIERICKKHGIKEAELREGGKRRRK